MDFTTVLDEVVKSTHYEVVVVSMRIELWQASANITEWLGMSVHLLWTTQTKLIIIGVLLPFNVFNSLGMNVAFLPYSEVSELFSISFVVLQNW